MVRGCNLGMPVGHQADFDFVGEVGVRLRLRIAIRAEFTPEIRTDFMPSRQDGVTFLGCGPQVSPGAIIIFSLREKQQRQCEFDRSMGHALPVDGSYTGIWKLLTSGITCEGGFVGDG